MKKLLLSGAMLVLATAAFAGPGKGEKTEVTCAVMGSHKVNVKEATSKKMFADYKGKRYFFCCAGCPAEFKKDSAKYAKTAESIATPKAGKPAPAPKKKA